MTCPICGGKSIVANTMKDCDSIHRKRMCTECKYIFYTSEYESDGDEYKRLKNENEKKYYQRKTITKNITKTITKTRK